MTTTAIKSIPADSLVPDEGQPRKTLSKENLETLAKSIRKDGLIAPLTVTPDGERYRIVTGERRWRAAKIAGLDAVPCIIRTDLSQADIRRLQFAENDLREALCPIERAEAYKAALDGGMSQEALAAELNVSRDTIAAALRLLELTPSARDAMTGDGLPETAARETLRLRVFDRLCGQGAMENVCRHMLWGQGRARTYREVRHLADHWLAQLWMGLLYQGEEPPRELPEDVNLDRIDAWCARYVVDERKRQTIAAELRADLASVESTFSFWVAWILMNMRPDFSRLTESDREAMRRAYQRVSPPAELDETEEERPEAPTTTRPGPSQCSGDRGWQGVV